MRNQTDVSDRGHIAAAKPPGTRVVREHLFDRVRSRVQPMSEPFHARCFIHTQLLLKILAHARHDEWMRVYRYHLRKCAHMRARTCLRRQERSVRVLLFEILKYCKRLPQWRTLAVDQCG